MTELHQGQREAIAEYVKGIPINGTFFSINGDSLNLLAKQILKAPPWSEYLRRIDLIELIYNCTGRFEHHIPQGYVGQIDLSPIADLIPDIEKELTSFLESFPRPYCVCFQLPMFSGFGMASTNLARDIALLDTSAPSFQQALLRPNNALVEVLAGVAPKKFERDSAYIQFLVPGYASYSLSSYSVNRAYSRLKEFVFLGIQTNIILEKGLGNAFVEHSNQYSDTSALHALVYNRDNIQESYRTPLPDEASKYLRWLRIDETKLKTDVPGKTVLGGGTRAAETHEEKATALHAAFELAAEFLDIDPINSNAERIRTAMEWYFDADITQNQTVSFIQRCIGLEAMLGVKGDDQIRSITDRLSDRYSYLLGDTASERSVLKGQFKKVYGKRSDLVHARRSILSLADEILDTESKSMLNKVVIKEVNGLLKALRKQKAETD